MAAAPRPLFSLPPPLPRQASGRQVPASKRSAAGGRGAVHPIPPGSGRRQRGPGSLTERPVAPSPRGSVRFQLKRSNLEQESQKMPGNSDDGAHGVRELSVADSECPRFYSC
ncbi:unnamed protein product [Coccothraustes coccothraustes]